MIYKVVEISIISVKDKGKNVILNNTIIVPKDENNKYYIHILEWLKNGNKIIPEYTDKEILNKTKKEHINKFNTETEQFIISGFKSSVLGTEYYYKSDRDDQSNLIGLVVANDSDMLKCGIIDNNGNVVYTYKPHSPTQIKQVFNDGKEYKVKLLQENYIKKEKVNSCTTMEELDVLILSMKDETNG